MSRTVPSSTTAARRRHATRGCAGRRGGTARSASYGAAAGSGARRRADPGTLAIGGRGSPSLERRRALRKCGAAHQRLQGHRPDERQATARGRACAAHLQPTVLSTASPNRGVGGARAPSRRRGASSSTPADEDSARELEREMTGFRSADRQRGGGGGDALTKAFLEGVQRIGEAESVRNARLF